MRRLRNGEEVCTAIGGRAIESTRLASAPGRLGTLPRGGPKVAGSKSADADLGLSHHAHLIPTLHVRSEKHGTRTRPALT